jgi:hypothetical protein
MASGYILRALRLAQSPFIVRCFVNSAGRVWWAVTNTSVPKDGRSHRNHGPFYTPQEALRFYIAMRDEWMATHRGGIHGNH